MDKKLHTALPGAELIIIKRDLNLVNQIATTLPPMLYTQLLPLIALVCSESVKYINEKSDILIELEQTSKYSYKEIRNKAKFFDLRINQLLRSVENVDDFENENYANMMSSPELINWNIHDNLGIFFDFERHIVGNTQYGYYVFQDEKMISKLASDAKSTKIKSSEVKALGYDMGVILGNLSRGLDTINDFMSSDFDTSKLKINHQDFNTNRCNSEFSEKYKTIRLFLLHMLSSIGFLLFALKKCIIRDTGLLLRFEYITYHYALKRLDKLSQYCSNNFESINDNKIILMFNKIRDSNSTTLQNSSFRNCMMHYGLRNKEGLPLISAERLDFSLPLCGLVESCFNGNSYLDFKDKLENELLNIYFFIDDYMQLSPLLAID